MNKKIFTTPQELIDYLDENDILMWLNKKEATVLLNYMEGHDYALGVWDNEEMVIVDMSTEHGEVIDYSIDEAILAVCEWNAELLAEYTGKVFFIDSRYRKLKSDEKLLSKMLAKTIYRKRVAG